MPNRAYLDDWDALLADRKALIDLYSSYDPNDSGLLSNSPFAGLLGLDDRDQMHQLLITYRRDTIPAR